MRGDAGVPYRLRFTKRGKVRFISHRDVVRAFDRAFRIAELPVLFTEGFSPRPKVSFGHALAVGYESDAEYLDVEFDRPVGAERLVGELTEALPEGIGVVGSAMLEGRAPSLQEAITSMTYSLQVSGERKLVAAAAGEFLAADRVEVTRRRKGQESLDDIRPAVRSLAVRSLDGDVIAEPRMAGSAEYGALLTLEVGTQPLGVRPGEVLAGLAGGWEPGVVRRTHQWIERDGARLEPLDADTRVHAMEAYAS